MEAPTIIAVGAEDRKEESPEGSCMILIDGVKYEEWTPEDEVEELPLLTKREVAERIVERVVGRG